MDGWRKDRIKTLSMILNSCFKFQLLLNYFWRFGSTLKVIWFYIKKEEEKKILWNVLNKVRLSVEKGQRERASKKLCFLKISINSYNVNKEKLNWTFIPQQKAINLKLYHNPRWQLRWLIINFEFNCLSMTQIWSKKLIFSP